MMVAYKEETLADPSVDTSVTKNLLWNFTKTAQKRNCALKRARLRNMRYTPKKHA